MKKSNCLCYVVLLLQAFLTLLWPESAGCFPEDSSFTSRQITKDKVSSERRQTKKQSFLEMPPEMEDEMRSNQDNLIRKKRSRSSSNLLINNYDEFLNQDEEKMISKQIQDNSARGSIFNKIAKEIKIRSNSSDKNPYVRRKRDLDDKNKAENDKSLIDEKEKADNNDSKKEKQKNLAEEAEYIIADDFEADSQADSEDSEEKSNEQTNLVRSKRESESKDVQNSKDENSLEKGNTDYEDSMYLNDDDSNIQETVNEEDFNQDYEKELKSKANVEELEKDNAVVKRETNKKSILKERDIRKTENKNKDNSRNLRQKAKNAEIGYCKNGDDLDVSKNNVKNQNLEIDEKLVSDQQLQTMQKLESDRSKSLEPDKKPYKESNIEPEMIRNINLDVKEDESEDDYEKRVEEQIQQKINAIKEEIKREVEENQKIKEIQDNNDKYDELQNQENEELNQKQSINNQIVLKRSLRKPDLQSESSIKRIEEKQSRSNSINHQDRLSENKKTELRTQKAQLRHKSIRKRSTPENDDDNIDQNLKQDLILQNSNTLHLNSKENTSKRKICLDDDKAKVKKSDSRVLKRFGENKAMNNIVPKGKLENLNYRLQNIEDDSDDEGNEVEVDGFGDQSSNLNEEESFSAGTNSKYDKECNQLNDPTNFLLNNHDYMMRREAHSAAVRNLRGKKQQSRKRKRRKKTLVKRINEKNKKRTGSSKEITPTLGLDYQETFGGLQENSDEALAGHKRIKRVLRESR